MWDNQHPNNCSKAKFLISSGWFGGFGSVIHVEGVVLAIAIELNRVLLPHPDGVVRGWPRDFGYNIDQGWQVDTHFCRDQNTNSLDCYYEPWSSCTLEDALRGKNIKSVPDLWFRSYEYDQLYRNGNRTLPTSFQKRNARHRTIQFINTATQMRFFPSKFRDLVACSPMRPDFDYYWWRAVATTYLMRPNRMTLLEIDKYRTLPISSRETCIAIYVRRGDKSIEMKLIPTENYLLAAQHIWDHHIKHKPAGQDKPVLFVSSEEPSVFAEVEMWARARNWRVLYTNLFNRSAVSARLDFDTLQDLFKNKTAVHHELEYLSMIVNLDYALRCDGWVCTLASNFCRLIDELRATVGGKINNPFADLSWETCSSPPCYNGSNIISVDW